MLLNYPARGWIYGRKDFQFGNLRYFRMNCEALGNRDVLRLKFTRQLLLRNPPGDYPARRFCRIDESNPGFSS